MSQSNGQGEAIMTKLLSDEALRGQILEILGNSIGDIADDADDIVALINTQKRLYSDEQLTEPRAIIAGLAERLNGATKKGRKYMRISEIEYSIGKNLAEQRARIK